MGDGDKLAGKRASGTREHVVAYLAEAGELYDKGGLASTRLAAAVGYPGSSVAFAQLLSGMERSGLIVREVHGKRTYRITLGDVDGFGPVSRAPGRPDPALAPGQRGDGFDYDELARRLLVRVVRLAAGADRQPRPPDRPGNDAAAGNNAAAGDAVAGLEQELATAWARHGKLAEENSRLREQLRLARQSLALAREQSGALPVTAELGAADAALLHRLLQQD